jgi:hypothetical protein
MEPIFGYWPWPRSPNNPVYDYHLGLAYLKVGDKAWYVLRGTAESCTPRSRVVPSVGLTVPGLQSLALVAALPV